jgi:anthranilate phosphoribosyltransferase
MNEPLNFAPLIERLCAHQDLSADDMQTFFIEVVHGRVADPVLTAVLVALKAKGETAAEITGAATALRNSALPFSTGNMQVADTCGTGGDGMHTLNVSTGAAFVAAAGGLPIVKHGNRSVSSRCGSADVLEVLGIPVDVTPIASRTLLDELGICFLFAPTMHPGVRHASGVRKSLGVRTIFNLLGPLANPAKPAYQVLGAGLPHWLTPIANTLNMLGTTAALIVHGGGLDELALHAETQAIRLVGGAMTDLLIAPEDAGLVRAPVEALRGGGPVENAEALQLALEGGGARAFHDAIALNAGALFWIANKAPSLRAGVAEADGILRAGLPAQLLGNYRKACDALKD